MLAPLCIFLYLGCSNPSLSQSMAPPAKQLPEYGKNFVVMGGDILLSKNDPDHQTMINAIQGAGAGVASRGIKEVSIPLWPNNTVPYNW